MHVNKHEKHPFRRQSTLVAAVLIAALILSLGALTACAKTDGSQASGDDSANEAPAKIIVADASTTHHLNLYIAQELGLFEKQGLNVEIVSVEDNAASRDLVVSGGADIFWSCPTVAIAAVANGAPIKAVAQVKKPCTSVLVVPADSPITELSDLDGKKIAGISPTCEAVLSISVAAEAAGATFELEKLAGGPAIAALESGAVDGAILEEPHVSIAELAGYKVLFPTISENIPCRTINANDAFIAAYPDELKAFIAAIEEANAIILADPTADDVVAVAVEYTGAPEEAIRNGNDRLKFDITLDVPGLYKLGEELVRSGNIKENPGERAFVPALKGITW